jgi:hypothetical protein
VPSTTQDNQWTSSQRFKGSDPWRDITRTCLQEAATTPH